jgi:hypothetical protein
VLLFTLIAAACFTSCFGDDGTSLWLTLVVPGAARADVRGRVLGWLLVVGPAGLLLTVVLTAVSGQTWAWPCGLAAEPALVIGCAGLLVLIGTRSVNALAADGRPSPAQSTTAAQCAGWPCPSPSPGPCFSAGARPGPPSAAWKPAALRSSP